MKAKKVVKRLDKVEALLSDVIKQFDPADRHVRNLLDVARASVARAKAAVKSPGSPATAAKAKAVVKVTKRKPVKAAARKTSASPVSKRRVTAKSKKVRAKRKAAVKTSASSRTPAPANHKTVIHPKRRLARTLPSKPFPAREAVEDRTDELVPGSVEPPETGSQS